MNFDTHHKVFLRRSANLNKTEKKIIGNRILLGVEEVELSVLYSTCVWSKEKPNDIKAKYRKLSS